MVDTAPLRFALPPSLGRDKAASVSRRLQAFVDEHLPTPLVVYVADSYTSLSLDLLSQKAVLGWGPPFVCARVEVHGGRPVLQAVRRGSARYRAALVCRVGDDVRMTELRHLVAAWVDRDSTGGYLLPAAFFKSRGVDIARAFHRTLFLGSYTEALLAVRNSQADVTAVFASGTDAVRETSALDELPGLERRSLKVFAHTEETPNDAILVAKHVDEEVRLRLVRELVAAFEGEAGRAVVREVFNAEGLAEAPPDGYRALHQLVLGLGR